MSRRVLVTGAAGCIGIHLVQHLTRQGFWVRAVDVRHSPIAASAADEFLIADLRRHEDCLAATYDVDWVFHLAADSGGVHYRATNTATPVRNNTLINLNLLEAARAHRVGRLLFASSTAIYPAPARGNGHVQAIAEENSGLISPQDSFGWEKLFAEQLCKYYEKDFGLDIRYARLQGIYGPHIPFEGGKEIALAALCRDIARAKDGDPFVIWGDGKQTRSYLFVDDCVDALLRIMHSDQTVPFNVGSDECISISDLVSEIAAIAGKKVEKRFDPARFQGVRSRRLDTSRLREVLAWSPKVSLHEGIEQTYAWIASELHGGPAMQPTGENTTRDNARKKPVRVRAISRSVSAAASSVLGKKSA